MTKNATYFLSLFLLIILSAAVLDAVPKFSEVSGASSPFSGISISGDQEFIYGDFDADGDVDINAYKKDALENDFWSNNGSGGFSKVTGSQNPFNSFPAKAVFDNAPYAFVADFDNDGDDDILATRRTAGKNIFYKNNSGVYQEFAGASSPFSAISIDSDNQIIWGDFDNDGDLDLHTYKTGASINDYWRNNGSGTFTQVTGAQNPFNNLPDQAGFFSSAEYAHVADWDNDGDDDIFLTKYKVAGDKVFVRNDNGVFTLVTGASSPFASITIFQDKQFIYGDFDSDGDIDMHASDGSSTVQTWLNNGSGSFTNATNAATNPFDQLANKGAFFNNALNAFAADWDNDGDDDVFTTNRTDEGQNILYRQGGAPPVLQSSAPTNGATGVAVDGSIVLNFNKNVTAAAGKNIIIRQFAGPVIATIPVTDGQITGSGTSAITINPSSDLAGLTKFYVLIDEGAFKDAEGRIFEGIIANNVVSFTTAAPAVVATVSTNFIENITGTSAQVGGEVNSDGGAIVTDRGIVWSTSPVPTVSNNKIQMGSGVGSFGQVITGLPEGTRIYLRAYAINSKGTAYGNGSSFYTTTSVTSINRTASSHSNAAIVNYQVVFAQSVTGVDTDDFTVTATGVTGASVGTITGSGKTYTVSVNTGSGNGTVRLDFTSPDGVIPHPAAAYTLADAYTIYKQSLTGDYYRSKLTTSPFNQTSGWESSADNAFWIDATAFPTSDAGAVTIVSGATITLPAAFTASAKNLTNNGVMDTGTGTIGLQGSYGGNGVVKGNGTVLRPDFTNAGTVSPGSSPGILSFTGNFTNTGTIDIELAGTTPGTGYDQLVVSGSVVAGGTINVLLINGFVPALHDEFTVISANTISGTFPTINLPSVAPRIWETTYDSDNGTLRFKVINDPMPVTLVDFEAIKESGSVTLVWSTSEESNSSHFEINRSSDGKNWMTPGRVEASGESSQVAEYSFVDTEPAAGINYYRLKMVDADRTFTYSRMREVAFGADLVLYPNPVHNELYIKGNEGRKAEVWDVAGNMRLRSAPKNGRLNVQSLPAGVYHLRVSAANGAEEVKRFVIVR